MKTPATSHARVTPPCCCHPRQPTHLRHASKGRVFASSWQGHQVPSDLRCQPATCYSYCSSPGPLARAELCCSRRRLAALSSSMTCRTPSSSASLAAALSYLARLICMPAHGYMCTQHSDAAPHEGGRFTRLPSQTLHGRSRRSKKQPQSAGHQSLQRSGPVPDQIVLVTALQMLYAVDRWTAYVEEPNTQTLQTGACAV